MRYPPRRRRNDLDLRQALKYGPPGNNEDGEQDRKPSLQYQRDEA